MGVFLKITGDKCGLADLSYPSNKVFKKNISTALDVDLDWIIAQTSGLFLVFDTIHCVGIDCNKKLIYDSSLPKCLNLCKEAFHHCHIFRAEEARQII